MQRKSSKNGNGSAARLTIVPRSASSLQENATSKAETPMISNGWKPSTGSSLRSNWTAMEVWEDQQARSILGTMYSEEAKKELLEKIDISTRQPKGTEAPTASRFARALRALRTAVGTILLGVGISGCYQTNGDLVSGDTMTGSGITRYVDKDYGVACYTTYGPNNRSMSCVQVRQGTKP